MTRFADQPPRRDRSGLVAASESEGFAGWLRVAFGQSFCVVG
jgi:hypothetical protein